MNNTLKRTTLLGVLALPITSYGAVALAFGNRTAIELANIVLFSLSCGILVAYLPIVWHGLRKASPDGGDILALGVFLAWLGVDLARGISIVWRMLGRPPSWLDSVWWGIHITLSVMGAICHLIAPGALYGNLPTREWLRLGLLVAISVAIGAAMIIFRVD